MLRYKAKPLTHKVPQSVLASQANAGRAVIFNLHLLVSLTAAVNFLITCFSLLKSSNAC